MNMLINSSRFEFPFSMSPEVFPYDLLFGRNKEPKGIAVVIQEQQLQQQRQIPGSKKYGFGIVNSEHGYSQKYLKALVAEIKRYPWLEQQAKGLRYTNSITRAVLGDGIIFGDAPRNFSYDYRVVDHLTDLQVPGTRIYDLVKDFRKILNALKKYYNANYAGVSRHAASCCNPLGLKDIFKHPTYKRSSGVGQVKVNLNVNVNRAPIKKKKANVSKVRIFNNFVKVGFDQFDIFLTGKKHKEFVIIDNQKFWIKADVLGHRRLYPAG